MILLQNINKYYYTDNSVTQALRNINLEFRSGEFVAVTGESGSGKSTLLNIISGIDSFDEGELYYNGEPTFQYDSSDWEHFRREQISFIFQDYSLIGHYPALDNITGILLTLGMDEKAAQQKAYFYLEKVGLKGLEQQRTSELSSGQKQRLSIARALAKETTVIVADEPTGNLDTETGEQIVSLLKEVAGNRLVIMVTHNYEQAAPYVTRKIRLHNGEVAEDTTVNTSFKTNETEAAAPPPASKGSTEKQDRKQKTESLEQKSFQRHTARKFAAMNRKTQAGRAFLFRFFLCITSMVSFFFIGQLYKNADDTWTKDYNDEIYFQKNDKRLSVRRQDGKAITDADIEKIRSVRHVATADSYDFVNDINYYCSEGKDFHYKYEAENAESGSYLYENGEFVWTNEAGSTVGSDKTPVFDKKNKFMRSCACITKEDLAKGRLPEKLNEIVLYSPDKKIQNSSDKEIYFTSENVMGVDGYYHRKFKIVGLLKEKTSQIYFHKDFCRMISAPFYGNRYVLRYLYIREVGDYIGKNDVFYLAINEELKENEVRVSGNYVVPPMEWHTVDSAMPVEKAVPGHDAFSVKVDQKNPDTPKNMQKLASSEEEVIVSGENFNDQSGYYLEVSEELFNRYFSWETTQASVYIQHYAMTDSVIHALEKLGYTAISTYRISSREYNKDKVIERLTFILISSGILLLLAVAEIFILRAFLKLRIHDFFVLKSMGMQTSIMRQISLYEIARYYLEAVTITCFIMTGLYLANVRFISDVIPYYRFSAFAAFILYNFLTGYLTVLSFNRLLKGRMGL